MAQRIPALTKEQAEPAAQELMGKAEAAFGKVINIIGATANSPVTLKALMTLMGNMSEATLDEKTQEAIALQVGEYHGCHYCRAAHTAKAKMTGASEEETLNWRKGKDADPKRQAAIDLAKVITEQRGEVSQEAFEAASAAGISDGEKLEVLGFVVQNIFTNYINHLCKTEVDFPPAPEL